MFNSLFVCLLLTVPCSVISTTKSVCVEVPDIADKCENEDDTLCGNLFSLQSGDPKLKDVPEDCINPDYESFVNLCRKRCFACCTDDAHKCSNKPGFDKKCGEYFKQGICTSSNPLFKQIAYQECPSTCGLCENTTACVDKDRVVCETSYRLCFNSAYKGIMSDLCPQTCGTCGQKGKCAIVDQPGEVTVPTTVEAKCFDRVGNCASVKSRCNNSNYKARMTEKCAKTCGFCK
ncbi:unnamed protein product [Enterobius vermicularis]|uniref:ShKT domain-containing protein n=1 Tax=Enterobius vermicularis TaxID=51028 RepID=A0A0N4VLA5_ENTVE|nr:unnamed protein product [Enterobius vermicularis]